MPAFYGLAGSLVKARKQSTLVPADRSSDAAAGFLAGFLNAFALFAAKSGGTKMPPFSVIDAVPACDPGGGLRADGKQKHNACFS